MRGAASQVFAFGSRLFEHALVLPSFLLAWGPDRYADWLLLHALALLVAFADGGQCVHWANRLSFAHAREDFAEFRRLNSTGVQSVVATVVVLGGIVGAGLLALLDAGIPALTATNPTEARETLRLMVVTGMVMLLQVHLLGLYRAVGEFPRSTVAGALAALASSLGTVAALAAGAGPAAVATVSLVIHSAATVVMAIDLLVRHPILTPARPRPRRDDMLELLNRAPLNLFPQIGQWGWQGGTVTIIGLVAPASEIVVAFVALRTLFGVPRVLLGQLIQTIGVEAARAMARNDLDFVGRAWRESAPAIACLAGATCGMAVGIGPGLLHVWSAGHVAVAGDVLALMAVGTVLASTTTIPATTLMFANRPFPAAIATIGGLTAGLGAIAALTPSLGLHGAVAGLLVGESGVQCLIVLMLVPRVVPIDWVGLLGPAMIRGMFAGLLTGVATWLAAYAVEPAGAVGRIVVGAGCGAIVAGSAIALIGLRPYHRQWLMQYVRTVMLPRSSR